MLPVLKEHCRLMEEVEIIKISKGNGQVEIKLEGKN